MFQKKSVLQVLLISVISLVMSVTTLHAQVFAKGADLSWLSQMESSGIKFYNTAGSQQDCIQILQSKGINSVRLRVWVNPVGGWSGTSDVVTQAVRAKNMGLSVMIDFHYSDTWADPGHQAKPAAWASLDFNSLVTTVYNYTYHVMDTLKANGVTPAWVQVGNETNDGMLWNDGKASVSMTNFAALVASGYDAVKAVSSTSKVIVHVSNGYDNNLFRYIFDGLKNNGGKWDVIGMSLYPTQSNWSTLNTQCLTNMNDMVARYGKEVMISETGMDVGPAPTVKAFLSDLIAKTRSVSQGKGVGVFYWEPEAYNKWQGYNKGAFDFTGKPTGALDAFLENPAPAPVANHILNPGFEAGGIATANPAGWFTTGDASASYTSAGNGWNPEGSYYLNQYKSSAFQVRTFQIDTVPNGHYTLSAWAIRGGGQNVCQLFANSYGGPEVTADIPFNDAWQQITIPDIAVTNNQVTIGIYSDGNAGNYLNVDSVTLTSLTILPVSLVSYQATLQSNGQVKLSWRTALENNIKSYAISRSTDGITFTTIGTIAGKGTINSESVYEWVDVTPVSGKPNYYRLAQIDLDNKTTVLGVKQITTSRSTIKLSVYPNPANTYLLVSGSGWMGKAVTFQLTSINGRTVMTKQLVAQTETIRLNIADIGAGEYFLKVSGEDLKQSIKVMIAGL